MKGSILVYGGNAKRRSNIYERLLLEDLSLGKLTNNPDILTVDKEDKKSIGISQIRELIKFINEKPFTHKKKAAIVVGAHTMTIQAQNALLKTLEELPSYASIILDSKNLSSILLTVQSRCQKIDARGWGREETSGDVSTENILDILTCITEIDLFGQTASLKKNSISYLKRLRAGLQNWKVNWTTGLHII
jgi:DNA polymerase III delta prime subunit